MYNDFYMYYNPFFYPRIPRYCDKPPTIYAILNSIVNFERDEESQIPIRNLAQNGYSTLFDFDFPLPQNITKQDFCVRILNHFMMRRIGYDTITGWQLQLETTLNSIMPIYVKMFNALERLGNL